MIEEGPVIESLLTMILQSTVLNEVAVASPPMTASFVIMNQVLKHSSQTSKVVTEL